MLWLNGFEGMDIRCVRLVPYDLNGIVVLDVQQVIPLPEATDYQVRVRRKEAERERARTRAADGRDFTKYHIVDGEELAATFSGRRYGPMVEQLAAKGVPLRRIHDRMPERGMRRLPGQLRDEDALRQALLPLVASANGVGRHFLDSPLVDEANDETYVVYKMWGTQIERVLTDLVQASLRQV